MAANSSFISNFKTFLRAHYRSLQGILLFALVVMLMRIFLFGNPYVWKLYDGLAEIEVGARQKDFIALTKRSFEACDRKYVVLGNSQARCIFKDKPSPDRSIELITLSSLRIREYGFYKEWILKYSPKAVILLLSEWNLSRSIEKESIILNPDNLEHCCFLAAQADEGLRYWIRLFFYQLMPELRFSCIPRAFLDRALGRFKIPGESLVPVPPPFDRRIADLRAMTQESMAHNLGALDDFVSFLSKRGISVIIAEGFYHPGAMNAHTMEMKLRFRKEMERIVRRYPQARFIKADQIKVFSEKDYRTGDPIHVMLVPGKAYRERLMAILKVL